MLYKATILFTIILTTQLSSCQKMENIKTEKLDWIAQGTAPKNYPVTILSPNEFSSNKGNNVTLIPNMDYNHSGWSGGASSMSSAPQPMPDHLSIVWMSETENKIYKGEFKLPQEKLYKLFKEGYMIYGINQEKVAKSDDYSEDLHKETYNTITVGLAPKGMVVVWITGQNMIEIGRFQAQEVDKKEANEIFKRHFKSSGNMPETIDKNEFDRFTPEVQEIVKQGKISSKQWDDYRLRYNWKMECNQPFEIYDYSLWYFNSEKIQYPNTLDQALFNKNILEPQNKAVPKEFDLYVTTQDGVNRLIRVEPFHEEETIEAFKKIHEASPDKPITMFFDIDAGFTTAKITLKNDKKEILLEKDTIKLFKLDKTNDRKNEK